MQSTVPKAMVVVLPEIYKISGLKEGEIKYEEKW